MTKPKSEPEQLADFQYKLDIAEPVSYPNAGRGIDNPHNTLAEAVTVNGETGTAEDLEHLTGEDQ